MYRNLSVDIVFIKDSSVHIPDKETLAADAITPTEAEAGRGRDEMERKQWPR